MSLLATALLIGWSMGPAGAVPAAPATSPAAATQHGDEPAPAAFTPEQVRAALARGSAYLLADQNSNGSWGGPQDSITTWSGEMWPNPEDHRAWKVATTGLCVEALLEVGDRVATGPAVDRGLRYLLDNADVKRPSEWSTMNNWAYIYGLQALAACYSHEAYTRTPWSAEIAAVAPRYLDNLARFQSVSGGWGYLEFNEPRTRRPQWATSFMTAAGVVALERARAAGFTVDSAVVARAVRAVQGSHLPTGGYAYHIRPIPNLHSEYIDQIKGSLSRIQVCQAALLAAGADPPVEEIRDGLGHFFRDHRFLDIALYRPIPHEAYYYNSGYFYMFGHYYAALVIARLPEPEQAAWWPRLQREILKLQQADGAIWDYDMHRYDKPYGVAYGLMALHRSLGAASTPPPPSEQP